jgi:hypothetical protein
MTLAEITTYPVTVVYGRNVEDAIAAGKYDRVNKYAIRDSFRSATHNVDMDMILTGFVEGITSIEAIRELTRRNLRPATFIEVLAFGESYPDVQRSSPIIALGSTWQHLDTGQIVPCLCEFWGERTVSLFWLDVRWRSKCRFAAIRQDQHD